MNNKKIILNELGISKETSSAGQQQTPPLYLSISLLGSLQISLNGKPVTGIEYDKVRALLVYLVMEHDHAHRRETLAELLWPDQQEQVGRDSLRQALSKLRQAIDDHNADPPFLLISRETLQFNVESHFALDAGVFTDLVEQCEKHTHSRIESCAACIQRLEQAAELYRGVFAESLTIRNGETFEAWLGFQRDYFQSKALRASSILADYHLRRGEYDLAQRHAWRQIELEAWHEEAYRQLMAALALSGQRTAALVQYERCCRVLEEELGVAPSAETTALYDQIRSGQFAPERKPPSTSTAAPALPLPSTSFVGRAKELATLVQRLEDSSCQLLTVIGSGGIGKTRLALEAARRATRLFTDIFFVPLASLTVPDSLAFAIANALDFSPMNQDDFGTQLISFLGDKHLLLILDSFEHLMAGIGLLTTIMARATGVKLLVTSRERLNLSGEWLLDLKGLPVEASSSSTLSDGDAVQLFVQRAQMVQPDFAFSQAVQPAITRICQLVNGLPLGIELATAWVQMLSCEEIANNISANLGFLTVSTRDIPERHQSLRAVFEQSWSLLSPEERRVFSGLSVFRGGFQAEAAREVCGAALSSLLSFVNKSMLRRDPQGRYEIHEMLRQYALEKLTESGEAYTLLTRHLHYYIGLVESAQLQGPQQMYWLDRLETENDNLRTAMNWSLSSGAPELGLRLAASLWFFWRLHHPGQEGLEWLEKLLTAAPHAAPEIRARALFGAGWLAQSSRDLQKAQRLTQASLELASQIGDDQAIAYPLSGLAWLAYFKADYQEATRLGEQSLTLFRTVRDAWGIAHTLNILGFIAESQADYPRAEVLQREARNVARQAGDQDSLAWSTHLLGRVMAEQGQYTEAVQLCNESLEIYRAIHNMWSVATALYTLADAALALGDLDQAATLATESEHILREMSDWWVIGGPLGCLGRVAYQQGDLAKAYTLSQESLQYFRQIGDQRGMAYALNTLGYIANRQAQYERASQRFKESLDLRRRANIRRGMEVCFEQLAVIAAAQSHTERAVLLFGAAEALRESLGVSMPESDFESYLKSVEVVEHQLGTPAFRGAWEKGRLLPLDQAVAYALGTR